MLQAEADLDAGPIWAWHEFPMREVSKSSTYNHEVTDGAVHAVREAVTRFAGGERTPPLPGPAGGAGAGVRGRPRPPVRQGDRRIDWAGPTDRVLRALWSADGSPGVQARIGGLRVSLYGGYPEDALRGAPGAILGTRDGAVCLATGDGAVWVPSMKRRPAPGDERPAIKLPASRVLGPARLAGVPRVPLAPHAPAAGRTYRQLEYWERGAVGFLRFAFPNGAMSTAQCRALRVALARARRRPTRVLVLLGGPDYWSNGIHLNVIEAARSPADESWRNINAIDDLVHDVITAGERLVVAALEGERRGGGRAPGPGGRPGVDAPRGGAQPALPGHGGPVRLGVLDLPPAAARRRGVGGGPHGGSPGGRHARGAGDGPARRRLRRDGRRSSWSRVEAQAHDLAPSPQLDARLREKGHAATAGRGAAAPHHVPAAGAGAGAP